MTQALLTKRHNPEAPSSNAQYLRSLVPNTIKSMVFGSRNLKYWVDLSSSRRHLPASPQARPKSEASGSGRTKA